MNQGMKAADDDGGIDTFGQRLSQDWWHTGIIDMRPGEIRYRGYPIEQLIGRVSFAQMIWLMLRGELPRRGQGELLDAALMSRSTTARRRPASPSRAHLRRRRQQRDGLGGERAGRRARRRRRAGCGAVPGDRAPHRHRPAATGSRAGGAAGLARAHGKFVSGFGHRFHPLDPRAPRLLRLGRPRARRGVVWATMPASHASRSRTGRGPQQADPDEHRRCHRGDLRGAGLSGAAGARAVLPVALGRHRPCLGTDPAGRRNKEPDPRQFIWTYDGHPPRDVPPQDRPPQD